MKRQQLQQSLGLVAAAPTVPKLELVEETYLTKRSNGMAHGPAATVIDSA